MRRPCCDEEWNNMGAWSKQEDQKLIDYIRAHGEGSWRSLPKAAGGLSQSSCHAYFLDSYMSLLDMEHAMVPRHDLSTRHKAATHTNLLARLTYKLQE
ncbi:hypothetical protein SAY87_014213 [Trapa incisa]|uniref:Uncharacterized protein n=1 Tax=Trapa incisa TaxID=236973 RepID=A0AAN7H2M0_9MYRT|nr:hypothetical protein SAY87_014213 [Trapa incisa]